MVACGGLHGSLQGGYDRCTGWLNTQSFRGWCLTFMSFNTDTVPVSDGYTKILCDVHILYETPRKEILKSH